MHAAEEMLWVAGKAASGAINIHPWAEMSQECLGYALGWGWV